MRTELLETDASTQKNPPRIYALVPAYNEQANIGDVVTELLALKRSQKPVISEVIVCDNRSNDNTAAIAKEAGAIVVHEAKPGYGAACLRAIDALQSLHVSNTDGVVFVDGDHSVRTQEVSDLIDAWLLHRGLVVGARSAKKMYTGAMSIHQRLGNLVASALIRRLWSAQVTDLGPFRLISYGDLLELNMQDERFGWTVEMQVKAIQRGLSYQEVEVSVMPRKGRSKISGTITGTVGAAYGIFSTVFLLRWRHRWRRLISKQTPKNANLKSVKH